MTGKVAAAISTIGLATINAVSDRYVDFGHRRVLLDAHRNKPCGMHREFGIGVLCCQNPTVYRMT